MRFLQSRLAPGARGSKSIGVLGHVGTTSADPQVASHASLFEMKVLNDGWILDTTCYEWKHVQFKTQSQELKARCPACKGPLQAPPQNPHVYLRDSARAPTGSVCAGKSWSIPTSRHRQSSSWRLACLRTAGGGGGGRMSGCLSFSRRLRCLAPRARPDPDETPPGAGVQSDVYRCC